MSKRVLVFILLMMFGLVPNRGAALCIAEGGHLALEFVLCCDIDDSNPSCDVNPKIDLCYNCDDTDKSEDCTDVTLALESLTTRSTTQDAIATQILTATLPSGEVARCIMLLQAAVPSIHETTYSHPVVPLSVLNTSVVLTV